LQNAEDFGSSIIATLKRMKLRPIADTLKTLPAQTRRIGKGAPGTLAHRWRQGASHRNNPAAGSIQV